MDEAGSEFRVDYMAGVYDKTCETCNGERVVQVIDEAACDRRPELKTAYESYLEQQREEREDDAMHRAEIAFGC